MPVLTEDLARTAGYIISEASGHRSREQVVVAAGSGVLKAGAVLGLLLTGDVTVAAAAKSGGNTGNGTLTFATAPTSAAVKAGVYQARAKATVNSAAATVQAGADKGSIAMDGSTPLLAGVQVGAYKIVVLEAPGAGEAPFQVEGPDGAIVGTGVTGTAFATEIKFAYTKGSATAAGDISTVVVSSAIHDTTPVFTVTDPDGTALADATAGAAYDGAVKFTVAQGLTGFVVGDGFDVTVTALDAGKYAPYSPAAANGSQTARAILYEGCDATDVDVRRAITARATEVQTTALVWAAGVTSDQKTAALAALATREIIAR